MAAQAVGAGALGAGSTGALGAGVAVAAGSAGGPGVPASLGVAGALDVVGALDVAVALGAGVVDVVAGASATGAGVQATKLVAVLAANAAWTASAKPRAAAAPRFELEGP